MQWNANNSLKAWEFRVDCKEVAPSGDDIVSLDGEQLRWRITEKWLSESVFWSLLHFDLEKRKQLSQQEIPTFHFFNVEFPSDIAGFLAIQQSHAKRISYWSCCFSDGCCNQIKLHRSTLLKNPAAVNMKIKSNSGHAVQWGRLTRDLLVFPYFLSTAAPSAPPSQALVSYWNTGTTFP